MYSNLFPTVYVVLKSILPISWGEELMGRLLRMYAWLTCCPNQAARLHRPRAGRPLGAHQGLQALAWAHAPPGRRLQALLQARLQPPGAAPCRAPRPLPWWAAASAPPMQQRRSWFSCMRGWRHEAPGTSPPGDPWCQGLPVRCLSKIYQHLSWCTSGRAGRQEQLQQASSMPAGSPGGCWGCLSSDRTHYCARNPSG